ncbi:hypothetical protein IMZ48_34245 [Candidatus Bathyarchaeota archaeon]|nr:hypothetical protein [Candidatus Bathyarchaeota archaeon]
MSTKARFITAATMCGDCFLSSRYIQLLSLAAPITAPLPPHNKPWQSR